MEVSRRGLERRATAADSGRAAVALMAALGGASVACEGEPGFSGAQADIETTPVPGTLLAFDEVVLGVTERSEPRVVVVRNVGTSTLELRSVTVEGEGAEPLRVSSFPRRLGPNAEGEVFMRFEPTTTGTVASELVLRSSDRDEPELRWPLRARVREPCRLSVTPTYERFQLGEAKPFRLTSTSSHRCVVVELATDTSLFEIESPTVPFAIEPGATTTILVKHTSPSVAPTAPIRGLRVRDSDGATFAAALEGATPRFGCLLISPGRVRFPTTPSNTVARDRVRVRNRCDEPMTIVDAAITRGFTTFTVLGDFPRSVPSLGTVEIEVEYRPATVEGDGGGLTLLTNDAQFPSFVVNLYGSMATGMLEVFPRQIDFGTVAFRNPQGEEARSECASPPRTVQILSTGAAAVTVSRLLVASEGDRLFSIASVTIDGRPVDSRQPQVLPAGSETQVALVFSPTRLVPPEHEARLVLEHDVGEGRTEVRLVGRGGVEGATRDVFRQPPGPKADILWVIDDTGSMVEEHVRLTSNLPEFLSYAESLQADDHIAVVTTDSSSPSAGRFRTCFPHPPILSSSYADRATREAAFRCTFDVGTNGIDTQEAGLGAAMRALERALDPALSPNPNAGFLRDDASLTIIVVSDENDQSTEPDRVLEAFYHSVKGRRGRERVKVHAIAYPVEEPCDTMLRFERPGYRYSRMTRSTGGLFFSVCLPSWQSILRNLAVDTFTLVDAWDLSRQADPATLTVTIDGVPIPQDPVNGWTYDPNGNSLRAHGTAVPAPGAEVVARYDEVCRP